jgi:CubicO group peptidase (beta-lactamase class C family)
MRFSMVRATSSLLALLLLPAAGLAQGLPIAMVPPESVGLSSPALAKVTALLDRHVAERSVAGAVVGVSRRGQVAYLQARGLQNLEARTPMTTRSLFRIYSMTKPVTAVAAMMLWQERRFQLDEPVSRYLPDFKNVRVMDAQTRAPRAPAREITIRDLFLHTSGLSHRTSQLYTQARVRRRDIPMEEFIGNIVAQPLMEDPGTAFRYSEATTVLGALIQVWSGKPLDQFMQERIFGPLGMTDTGFWVEPERRARLATVYRPAEGRLEPFEIEAVPFTEPPALLEGAVGLVSTVPDFMRFAQMLLNGGHLNGVRILRPETVEMMTENGLNEDIMDRRPGSMGWGLANVNVVMEPAALDYPSSAGEYGWDGTAGTIFWVDPVQEMIIVLMTQSSPADPGRLRPLVKTAVYDALIP